MYDAFWTQASIGMAEFSDVPLNLSWSESNHGFFPAKHVTTYLEAYVDSHVYSGRSLRSRIQFNMSVQHLSKHEHVWIASTASRSGGRATYRAPKIIDASGITSIPSTPRIPGQDVFKGLQIHSKDFPKSDLLTNPAYHRVLVLGGAKSAADIVYAATKAGKSVSWVIRRSGSGPAAFTAPPGLGTYRSNNESFYNHWMSYFLLSAFQKESWVTWFLNRTAVGRRLARALWTFLDVATRKSARYNRPDGRRNGFHHLEPDTTLFWQNDSTGVNQREDFWDLVAEKVRVYRQDTERIEETGMLLVDGKKVDADAIVYATGWKHAHPFLDESLAAELGLSVPKETSRAKDIRRWEELERSADVEVLHRFPELKSAPETPVSAAPPTPLRLYKSILPLNDHSIVFLGQFTIGNAFITAESQSLWATAALDGTLVLPPAPEMEYDVAQTIAWCRRRYLAKGQSGNWFYWDVIPYTDMLLDQLGLQSHQRKGWFTYLVEPFYSKTLRGLIPEYREKLRNGAR